VSDIASKYYFRQRNQNRLYDTVLYAVQKSGKRRNEIADILEIPPSQVTRLLSGPANWTNDTTSDLLYAVGSELNYQVVKFSDRAVGNRFHPAGEPAVKPVTFTITTTGTASVATTTIMVPSNAGWVNPTSQTKSDV